MHFGQFKDAVDRNVYPDVEQYWEDMITVFRQEIDELYAVGCRYLQLDEVPLALLCDPNIRALAKQEGDDPDQLVRRYVDIFNRAVAQRRDDMTIAMHVCRGNMVSLWMGDGGYAPVAEVLFRDCDVDAYLCLNTTRHRARLCRCGIYRPASALISGLSAPRTRRLNPPTT
jgi:5-methyltetrahydropteroyltriglutamate--homocysteine methyltransferase